MTIALNRRIRLVFGAVLLTATLSMSKPASAQYEVYDPWNHAELVTQFNQMVKSYQQQLQQLQQQIQQTGALTGTRSMGGLLNGTAEADLRRYLPPDWQTTLAMGGATGLTSSATRTQNLYSGYYRTYVPISGAVAIASDPTGPLATALDRRTETTYASMAAAEQSYNATTPRVSTYEALLKQVDATTDLKASIDLQSRINAENGLAINELVRLNSLQVQQKASEDNQALTGIHRSVTANTFDPTAAQNAFNP
jgi:type IV secretion system protein VirB5